MLPELTQIKNKREAKITPRIIKWFEEHYSGSVALEIKIGNTRVLPHQKTALRQVQSGVFSMKLPDTGRKMPFDVFILKRANSFVVRCNGNACTAYDMDGSTISFEI